MISAALGPSLFVGVLSHVSDGAGGEALGQAAGFSAAVALAAGFAVVGLAVSLYHAKRCNAQKPATPQPAQAADGSTLRAIMKTDVFSLRRDQPVVDALKLFADKGISGAPVVDDAGVPVGFISDGDIMQYLADQVPAFKSAYSFVVEHGNADFDAKLAGLMGEPIAHIAHDGVITVDASADMGEVARLLAENHLKKAPVMEDGRMVGIINRSNVTKYSLNWYFANQSAQV